jgi:hypothetical protein
MPKSKAELIVELREQMKGTPFRLPTSSMRLHELETAAATLADFKSKHTAHSDAIPVVGSGRPKSRPIEPVAAEEEDDDGGAIKVPEAPKPRITKAPPIRVAKDPINHPLGSPLLTKKKPKAEEEARPLKGKSDPSHICNCPHCPTRK